MTDGSDVTNKKSGKGGGGEPEPSDSLKTFGEVVKVFRKRAGLTQEQFAPLVGFSVETIASIEQGRRFPQHSFVERAEEVLDAFGVIRAAAKHLVRRPGIASWFQQWAALEREAVSLYTYECRMIPGLLQPPAYTRSLFREHVPPMDDEQIDAMFDARLERQSLLRDRATTAYSFIIEEHVLLRNLGGEAVTRELIEHIYELAQLRNVEIQIMPVSSEGHSGLHGPVQLLETPENKWFAYSEGQENGQLISDSKVVSTLQMRYARMRSQALSLTDSLSLLRRMRGAP